MAVLLETSRGDIVIDLFVDECPKACLNFLKLCKIKYYNDCLFHNVQENFIIQTGDPEGSGRGGNSIYGVMYGDQARFFEDEVRPNLKHRKKGMVGMAGGGADKNTSQFYITTGENLDSLDERYTLFGEVAEGLEVAMNINDTYCDDSGRPFQNIRIRHTIVLEDPFDDPPMLADHIPEKSPEPLFEQGDRLEDDWVPEDEKRTAEEIEEEVRKNEARNRAVVLEMIGDLPEAEVKPPSNMLFVCKLNPVTAEEDLETLFARFGTITSCDIIRDWKTGDSLCYGFIGFDSDEACEEAYFKMNNVLIDDRRIKVDFSQSVYHLWRQFRKFGRKGNKEEAGGDDALGLPRIEKRHRERHGDAYELILDHGHAEQQSRKRRRGDAGESNGHHRAEPRHRRGRESAEGRDAPERARSGEGREHGGRHQRHREREREGERHRVHKERRRRRDGSNDSREGRGSKRKDKKSSGRHRDRK